MRRFRYMPAVITLLVIAIATGMVDAQARAAGPAQPALGPVDLYFVTQTSLGTPFQVDSGQLAEEKGGTQAIRSYAELMVSSHEAVNGALQAILQRKGPLPPPTLLQAAYATIVSTLQDEAGPAFDQDYVRGQVDYQKANAALYQYEITNGSRRRPRAVRAGDPAEDPGSSRKGARARARCRPLTSCPPPVQPLRPNSWAHQGDREFIYDLLAGSSKDVGSPAINVCTFLG